MPLRHDNLSQVIKPVPFSPLLQDEGPYYNNLNRGPKNAYDYADNLNKILSYGGSVSRIRPINSHTAYSLYNTVKIVDGEVFETVVSLASNDRFGIIVTEKDAEGYYIVCTFCPNFVFPANILQFTAGNLGASLTINIGDPRTSLAIVAGHPAGSPIVGKVTGSNTIFFTGTVRLFGVV